MLDLFTPVDQYCERTDATFWSEPLNLLSNIGFIIAGLLIVRTLKSTHYRNLRKGSWVLAALMFVIGIGSALFHSLAIEWAKWADIIPIALFILTYLWLFFRYTAGLNALKTILGILAFGLLTLSASKLANHELANGGEGYFGTWITLFGISCFYGGRKQALNQWRLLFATVAFAVSIYFRTMDLIICESWPYGTHVLWHLLNSLVLFLTTSAYVTERGKP